MPDGVTIEGKSFFGFPYGCNDYIWSGWSFYLPEQDFKDRLDAHLVAGSLFPKIDVFISHGPIFKMHDLTKTGFYTGNKVLSDYIIDKIRPKVFVCGHIHEQGGQREDYLGTQFINAAILARDYRTLNNYPMRFSI